VLGVLGFDFCVTQPEAVVDPWQPMGYRGIVALDVQVAGPRMVDPAAREPLVMVGEAMH
jgi:hypothetical protein